MRTIYFLVVALCMLFFVLPCFVRAESLAAFDKGVNAFRVEDYEEAYQQWRIAMEEDVLSAYNNAAYLTQQGLGVEKDMRQALEFWLYAAQKGHAEAQYHIGKAYFNGTGVDKNLLEAYAWCICSYAKASKDFSATEGLAFSSAKLIGQTQNILEQLRGVLSAEELQQGKQLALRYINQYAAPYWTTETPAQDEQ
ncbi:MAG: sel1 repeat family protein [Candidatus Omnitrophica bacterium]|nr:sel1 repeat family protein [Candidatus Omnitrophota bacterium]